MKVLESLMRMIGLRKPVGPDSSAQTHTEIVHDAVKENMAAQELLRINTEREMKEANDASALLRALLKELENRK